MREGGQENWWRRSVRLAAVTVGGAAVACLVPWLLSPVLAGRTALGLPISYFLFVIVVPIGVFAAVFWFARRQDALDHRYDVTGRQG